MQEDKGDCTEMEKKFLPRKEDGIRVLGRTNGACDPLVLFWTGSGIEMMYDGTELWCEFESDYGSHEQWIAVLINGALISRQMLPKGRSRLCLLRGLSGGKQTKVTVLKEVQAMPGDEKAYLAICGLYGDGTMKLPPEPSCKIEFIGDSITSGEGSYGAQAEEDWISMWFSATHAYPYLVTSRLGAECRIVSQSGYGLCCAWDNNPDNNIPAYYEQVCGVLCGERNETLGAKNAYDFTSWQPDYVVINLGTNDAAAFSQPEWKEESSGRSKKMRFDKNGFPAEEDFNEIKDGTVKFLKKVRKHNPKAMIFWAFGLMGTLTAPAIKAGIAEYGKLSGDSAVCYLELPEISGDSIGARSHPGVLGHQAAADALYQAITKHKIR